MSILLTHRVLAQDTKLIIIPDAMVDFQNASQTQQISSDALEKFKTELEQGLKQGLAKNVGAIVDSAKVFNTCRLSWCAEVSLSDALDKIRQAAPEVQLVILYSFDTATLQSVSASAIDPLTFDVFTMQGLDSVGEVNNDTAFSLGYDLSIVLSKALSEQQYENEYQIKLQGFKLEELAGLSTHILSNTANVEFLLIESSQSYSFLDRYFPVTNSLYSLQTLLLSEQLKASTLDYFARKNIKVDIVLNPFENRVANVQIQRRSSPYIPSLLSSLMVILLILIVLIWTLRRQYLQFYLQEFAEARDADAWLSLYKKVRFPLYRLSSRYASHASYWQRCKLEAEELATQAKMYFDAGDTNTSKLFVSKALYKNKADTNAHNLVKSIESIEKNSKKLSENEQWLRNKIAKAMNNYRRNQSLKALKQLYQAAFFAKKEKPLKKQYKAIIKLINKFNAESENKVDALVCYAHKAINSHIVINNTTIHLGRMPSKSDATWISPQDSVYFINHKAVSRVGQHCYLQRTQNGYELAEQGSKNGTFVNLAKMAKKQSLVINNEDKLHLGGDNSLTAATLVANVSKNRQCLQLAYDTHAISLLARDELNKIWPDNALALGTQLTCSENKLVLLYKRKTKTIELTDADEFDMTNLTKTHLIVCCIQLGEKACIEPFKGSQKLNSEVLIDDVSLLGKVPLTLPCKLSIKSLEIQLTAYDNNSGALQSSVAKSSIPALNVNDG